MADKVRFSSSNMGHTENVSTTEAGTPQKTDPLKDNAASFTANPSKSTATPQPRRLDSGFWRSSTAISSADSRKETHHLPAIKTFLNQQFGLSEHQLALRPLDRSQFLAALFELVRLNFPDMPFSAARTNDTLKALTRYFQAHWPANMPLTFGHLVNQGYELILDFQEEIDVPVPGEADDSQQIMSIRHAAQGAISSTCTAYSLLSLMHSLGTLKPLLDRYGVQSYSDLDRFTAKILEPFQKIDPDLFRYAALETSSVSSFANASWNTETTDRFSFSLQITDAAHELLEAHPEGILAFILDPQDPDKAHTVHLLNHDPVTDQITYYDPMGSDGQNNVHVKKRSELTLARSFLVATPKS